jgi:hypothetical protein
MGKTRDRVIAVQVDDASRPRKLTKIVGYGDRGFAVLTPYHRARKGFVGIMPVDYKKVGELHISDDDVVRFSADEKVKLSYHTDGFAQFSGEVEGTIRSGRDPLTGQPKGVGLRTNPLSDPVRSGPSAGIVAWGLDDFDELEADDDTAVIFRPGDLYFRGCTPEQRPVSSLRSGYFLNGIGQPCGVVTTSSPFRWRSECSRPPVVLSR